MTSWRLRCFLEDDDVRLSLSERSFSVGGFLLLDPVRVLETKREGIGLGNIRNGVSLPRAIILVVVFLIMVTFSDTNERDRQINYSFVSNGAIARTDLTLTSESATTTTYIPLSSNKTNNRSGQVQSSICQQGIYYL